MNDPHVAYLEYRLVTNDWLKFSNPPDVEVNTPDFTGKLSNEVLTLMPKGHFQNESEIKPVADAFVQTWETEGGLRLGRPFFQFQFRKVHIIDRSPTAGAHVYVGNIGATVALSSESSCVFRRSWPLIPE